VCGEKKNPLLQKLQYLHRCLFYFLFVLAFVIVLGGTIAYDRSCEVRNPWDDPVDDVCKQPYILFGEDGEVHSVSHTCYCRRDKCNGIGGWTTETLFERPSDAPRSKPAATGGKTGGTNSSGPAAVSGQSGPSADPVMTVGVVVLFISVIVA